MSLIHWQFLHALETVYQQIQVNLINLIENGCESTIWMGAQSSDLISQIKVHETDIEIMLDIQLAEQLTDLEVQVSSETAVVRARSTQDEVEGFFRSGLQQHIIPLPIAVHPEVVRAGWQNSLLTLTLPKAGKIDRQCIALALPNSPSSKPMEKSMANLQG